MKKEKVKFINGCVKQGYTKKVAENIFSLIEKFVGYGFNKAHSASYGMIAYQTAYMKANFPVEFMTAVLTAESRSTSGPIRNEKISRAVLECRRMKIGLLPPDINKSDVEFTIEKNEIRFGLSAIKNVGSAAIESILNARREGNFKTFTEFISRVDLSKVNRKTLESMIKAGAVDQFGKRAALLTAYSQIVDRVNSTRNSKIDGQESLFSLEEKPDFKDNLPEVEELSKEELLAFERDLLGFFLSEHPLTSKIQILEKKVTHRINSLSVSPTPVVIGGLVTQVRKIITKKSGSEMAFVKIDDFTGSIELVIFPSVYERTKYLWINDNIILVKGRVNEREERLSVVVDDAKALTQSLNS